MPEVYGIDGHDGTGKTTLAQWLANEVSGSYQRPFGGARGKELMEASRRGDHATVLAIGEAGIKSALRSAGAIRPIILDRAWMTVASLVPWTVFSENWNFEIPTVLCWADLPTTLARLAERTETIETVASHKRYLKVYANLADRSKSYVLRTDVNSLSKCQDLLLAWLKMNNEFHEE